MSRPLWQQTDAEIWAQVDAAWLLEAFRTSEQAEAPRAHLPHGSPQGLADIMDNLLRDWAAASIKHVGITLHEMHALYAELIAQPASHRTAANLQVILNRPARSTPSLPRTCPDFPAALEGSRRVRLPRTTHPRPRHHRRQHR
ncbi:hypothetical protein [Deinococcus sp. ME38]|uniref:hypothetical protein n=1 Tax=Deinococcus sp. ME38 TaxID=3400344 RepID=UPI003B5C4B78